MPMQVHTVLPAAACTAYRAHLTEVARIDDPAAPAEVALTTEPGPA